jgi:hypothetical protein
MVMTVVEGAQQVFRMLALELYRKQCLVQEILGGLSDEILVTDNMDVRQPANENDPKRVADECSSKWSRRSKESKVDDKLLQDLLRLGENGVHEVAK